MRPAPASRTTWTTPCCKPARYTARPAAGTDALFVSLRTRGSAVPEPIRAGAVGDIVTKHAAAGVREDRRTAHALCHTFCTMVAERGVALEVIRALAGHIDVRTTQIDVDVTDQRQGRRHRRARTHASSPCGLVVRPEEIVPLLEANDDGRLMADGAVWSSATVEVKPAGELAVAFVSYEDG